MKNISLIGMAACGKSTIGVLLAKTLGMMFCDTDLLIQQRYGRLLCELLEEYGVNGFNRIEEEVIFSLECENTCIATGGSAVYSPKAMLHLKDMSTLVFIDVGYDEIERRIEDIKSRGVAIEEGKTLRELYYERRPLYEKHADITINANGKTLEEIIVEIRSMLKL